MLISQVFIFNACGMFKPKRVESENSLSTYEKKLGIVLPVDINMAYIKEITKHINAPYKYGGNGNPGFDCSGLVNVVYQNAFKQTVPRQSSQLHQKSHKIIKSKLRAGDLYFFIINGKKVDHVGMHIHEEYFIHASTKAGVIVSSLSEPYYKKTFVSYGSMF